MADYLTNTSELTLIADAIRTKGDTIDPLIYPYEFAQAILDIPTEWDEEFLKALIERTFTIFSNSRMRSAGAYAFAGCSLMNEVSLPALRSLADYMFMSCYNLS